MNIDNTSEAIVYLNKTPSATKGGFKDQLIKNESCKSE